MTEPLTDDQLAAMLSERQLTAIRTTASALATIPAYRDLTWRTVATDSERIDGIAPVCASDEHGRLDDGARDEHGTYDCCPWPVVECHSEALASHLVALLTGAPTLLAEVDRLRYLAEQQSASLTALGRYLDEQRIALAAHDAAQRADESRAAVANLRIVELNAEAAQLRERVAELEAASGQRQEEMSRYWAAEVIIERAMAKGYDPDRYALAEALDLSTR